MAPTSRFRRPLSFVLIMMGIAILSHQPTEAVNCARGRFVNKLGQCSLCPIGTYSDRENAGYCKPCADGTTSPLGSNSKVDCEQCKGLTAGRFGKCNRCPKGTYTSKYGSLRCKKCNKLVGVGQLSNPSCRWYAVCRPGKFSFLKQCPFGSCWLDSKQCCVDSKDGKTCVEKLSGTCPAGSGIENDVCDKCPNRYYRSSANAPAKCKPCPRGTQAALDRVTCRPCRSLTYNPKKAGLCQNCPKGTYALQTKRHVGRISCTTCPKRRLFRDPLKECWQYVECKPGARPRSGVCTVFECFNNAKQCCENVQTKKCERFP